MPDSMDPPPAHDEANPVDHTIPGFNRREFFRLIGAAAFPLVVQGCTRDDDDWDEQLRAVNLSVEQSVSVKRASHDQPISSRSEHLSIDDSFTQYLSLGDQCRILRSNGRVALYTVGEIRQESSDNRVRMGTDARSRLGTTGTFNAKLSTAVVAEGLTDAQAQAQSEFVERLVDDGAHTKLVAIAAHGGSIEPRTDQQAEYVQIAMADKHVSSWICKGYKQGGGAFAQWHITTTNTSRHSFPGLDLIADRGFEYSVSFHGQSDPGVIVGGGAPLQLREAVRDAIVEALALANPDPWIEVIIAPPDNPHSGLSPENLVNWLTEDGAGGIQISQSLHARNDHWEVIAQAVVDVFDPLVG